MLFMKTQLVYNIIMICLQITKKVCVFAVMFWSMEPVSNELYCVIVVRCVSLVAVLVTCGDG